MIFSRRLPGVLFKYKYTILSCLLFISAFVYFLLRWNIICTNVQTWQHVAKICKLYEDKKAVGSLCIPLCVTNEIQSLTCHSFQGTKDAVFSAEWHGTRLVFKSASSDVPPIHWYDNGEIKYPTDKEFRAIISTLVKKKLNFSIPHDTAIYISRLKPTVEEKDKGKKQLEMDNVWVLIQDNEYLLSYLFAEQDIFPQLLGTCGPYFAVEYVGPISDSSSLLSTTDSKEEWGYKLKISTLIMAFLDDLGNSFRDQMHLCDIKLEHFGIVHDRSKLKFLDLVHVFPKSTVNKIINHVTKSCENDNECDFYDCRSKCDKDVNKCRGVTNTNLQMVCEKLFLGWRMSNTLIVPGLLISQHTPSQLASILRQCANPEIQELIGRVAPSEDVKNSLRNVLSEVEKSVNEETEEI